MIVVRKKLDRLCLFLFFWCIITTRISNLPTPRDGVTISQKHLMNFVRIAFLYKKKEKRIITTDKQINII